MATNFLGAPDVDWYKPRLNGVMFFILAAFVLLVVRLFYLQGIEGKDLKRMSVNNSIRLQSLAPPRGLIFDRQGVLLVDNRPSFDLSIVPKDARPIERTIQRLARYLEVPSSELGAKIAHRRGISSFRPVNLKSDIGRNALAAVEAHKLELPGVHINVWPQRDYLRQASAAHLIGYLSEISPRELKRLKKSGYRSGDLIGKFGIEKVYEQFLRGTRGGRQVEVNVTGQVVRILKTVQPQQGNSVYLSIDHRLQAEAEKLLMGRAGAIVAMDPGSGHVLALVSSPSFDQNAFVNGMSHTEWDALVSNPQRPMENKAIHGEYPPASAYKVITAMAGLEEGIVDPDMTVLCTGEYAFGDRVFRCWKKEGHGRVNLTKALAESCDIYFYQLGHKVGVDRLAKYALASGLGNPTGISLEDEAAGLIPTAAWKKGRFGVTWQKGETLSVAIGQGYNLATPLQMAVLFAALANGGVRHRPLIINRIETTDGKSVFKSESEVTGTLPASPKTLQIIQRGLWEVVNNMRGTAWKSRVEGIDMCGKTGTAQLFGRKDDAKTTDGPVSSHLIPHAWFVAYAPAVKPRIVVSVIVEHGDSGSRAAAPIAGQLIRLYMSRPGGSKQVPQTAQRLDADDHV